jgi:hypothetical protein
MLSGRSNTNSVNATNAVGPVSWLAGKGIFPQLLMGLVIVTIIYIVLISLESLYKTYNQVKGSRVELMPYNCSSTNKTLQFVQHTCGGVDADGNLTGLPTNSPFFKHLPLSDNERTGAEFSYSFYLWVDPVGFREEDGLLHVFHKGYNKPFPLMGPGVFMKSNTNVMRVYMNSSETWNNYVEVENFPVKKWVHVVISARANAIEVYINGNLSKKMKLQNAVFYQNFQDLFVFSQQSPFSLSPTLVPSLQGDPFQFWGPFRGNLSSLYYYTYALSYTEIDSLLREGPSSRACVGQYQDQPPYLQDNWWINNYAMGGN